MPGKLGKFADKTTPSMMDFEIIGTAKEDFAVNVYFDDLKASFWFDSDLLENIDDGQGTVITFDGVNKKWTKGQNGEWIEENTITNETKLPPQIHKTKWWSFWK